MKKIVGLLTLCLFLFGSLAIADIVYVQGPQQGGKPKLDVNPPINTPLKLTNIFGVSISMSTANPGGQATFSATQKIVKVMSNCPAKLSNNSVTFQCLPEKSGPVGYVFIEHNGEANATFNYSAGVVFQMETNRYWSAEINVPKGEITKVEGTGVVWVNGYNKIRRLTNNSVQVINRPGDLNLDGIVNILDMVIVSKIFGTEINSDAPEDLNWDGTISRDDLNVLTTLFGTKYNSPPSAPPKLASGQTPTIWGNLKK